MEEFPMLRNRKVQFGLQPPPFWVSLALSIGIVALIAYLRFVVLPDRIIPAAHGLPLLLCIWFRNKRLLWGMVVAFLIIALMKYGVFVRESGYVEGEWFWGRIGAVVELLAVAGVVHMLISNQQAMEKRSMALASTNEDLANTEQKVISQNQSLEEQAEELRAANEELNRRQASLESMVEKAAGLFESADQERRRLRAVLETVPFGVVITNADATEIYTNRAGAEMLGVPTETNLAKGQYGKQWVFCRDDKPLPSRETLLMRALKQGQRVEGQDVELVFMTGERISLMNSAAPIRDRNGKIVGAVGTCVDITAQKKLQEELEKRRREAEEAAVRKTRFLAAVSHDIRTPANAISLLAELIQQAAANGSPTAETPQLANELYVNSRALVNLVSDVLDITRFDTGQVELQPTEFDLQAMLKEECRKLHPMAEVKGVGLEYIQSATPLWIRTDRIKLGRVVANILDNGIKFTEQGKVEAKAERLVNGDVEIQVTDTGVGIASQYLPNIFDEFFQLRNPERDRNKGTGLGLAICRRLVEAMGGQILVESVPGKGSTFKVRWPKSVVAAKDVLNDGRQSAPLKLEGRQLAGMRVLLVEDHTSTRRAAARLLAAQGAIVNEAADAGSALQQLKQLNPHVLLLDMMLPDMDGAEVLKAIQVSRPTSLRKILVLTGDMTEDRLHQVKQLGADALMAKPVDVANLVATLKESASPAIGDGEAGV